MARPGHAAGGRMRRDSDVPPAAVAAALLEVHVRHPRPAGDDGAVAVLVALVVVGVLLPVSALGLNTYVRNTTLAELQRSADSAALAGAASIPLSDPQYVRTLLALPTLEPVPDIPVDAPDPVEDVTVETPDPPGPGTVVDPALAGLLPPGAPEALLRACIRARAAAEEDGRLSDAYGRPTARSVSTRCGPGDPDGAAWIRQDGFAHTEYLPDSVFTNAQACLDGLETQLSGSLEPTTGPLPPAGDLGVPSAQAIGNLLPALLRPGVRVTLRQGQSGPLEGILGGGTAREEQIVSTARRRFKNVVVLPVVAVANRRYAVSARAARTTEAARDALDQIVTAVEDPADALPLERLPNSDRYETIARRYIERFNELAEENGLEPLPVPPPTGGVPGILASLPSVIGDVTGGPDPAMPASCTAAVRALMEEYEDLIAPVDGRTQEEILSEAACLPGSRCREEDPSGADTEPVLTVLYDVNRATLYDVLPVCFPRDPEQRVRAEPGATVNYTNPGRIPDGVTAQLEVEIQLDPNAAMEQYLNGARCTPGTPGAFRASLTRS